jgi:hypothetical protein
VPRPPATLRPTRHPRIKQADATRRSQIEVAAMLREVSLALDAGDTARLRALVATRIDPVRKADIPAVSA